MSIDLSLPAHVFNYLNTDDERLAWIELNKIGERRAKTSLTLILGSDVERWAVSAESTHSVLQLKERLCKIVDLRIDQVSLVLQTSGILSDELLLGDIGVENFDFVGVMISVGKTVALHSSVLDLLTDFQCNYDKSARLVDMHVHVMEEEIGGGGGILGLTPCVSQR
jgi:hypothetical protein